MLNNKDLTTILQNLKPHTAYTWDDKGLGALFAKIYNDVCRYNITSKEWYIFNGKIWTEDKGTVQARRFAKQLAKALIAYAEQLSNDEYTKFVKRLGGYQSRQTMLKDSQEIWAMSNESLDKNLSLLNCINGTLNLDNYEFKEHDHNDLLSKITNVVYDEKATSERFQNFINEVMQGDLEKTKYLQKILGYSLTGDTSLEQCFLLFGPKSRNGKSTLVETYAYMLGNTKGYAMNMQPETLAARQKSDGAKPSGDIARLNGCRFLNASEPPKRMVFNSSLLKQLLGRDTVTARQVYEKNFDFIPIFKLVINTNYLPMITDDTLFSSGRIKVITFDRHFEPNEQDKTLKDILKQQDHLSGLFNWCIEGLKLFRQEGALPPQSVIEATADYRLKSDKLGNFLTDCLEKCPNTNIKLLDVYNVFKNWCQSNGYGAENKGNFKYEIESRIPVSKTGTVGGITVCNVIKDYKLVNQDMFNYTDNTEEEPF